MVGNIITLSLPSFAYVQMDQYKPLSSPSSSPRILLRNKNVIVVVRTSPFLNDHLIAVIVVIVVIIVIIVVIVIVVIAVT